MMTVIFTFVVALLHLFDLDEVVIDGLNEITGKSFTTSVYWLTFLVLGLFIDVIGAIVKIFN